MTNGKWPFLSFILQNPGHFFGTYPATTRVCYRAVVGSVYNSSTMAVAQFTDWAQIDESLPAR
ncbi:MAG: hypothetical protein DMF74_24835 [Acidobacteria bacterium]|nr:MAG: hypothetical protein DMF74_24835 [Acidobacteriota bacterium]